MNFLIIGHSVVDKITRQGKTSIKPGGVFYSVISFLSQIGVDDKLFLCSAIEKKSESLFKEIYNRVDNNYLQYVDSIPEVELKVDETGERNEKYSQIPCNLIFPTFNLNQFDGILINMITGFDISLAQLQEIRKNYQGFIYFDVHTLSRGVDKNFNRSFRRINEFNEWSECIDILQTNEKELLTLSEKNDETEIIDGLLSTGVQQIIITRAERGVTIYFREDKLAKSINKESLKLNSVNKIGCGDVFGSVYFYNYVRKKNIVLALDKANLYAGISTTYSNVKDYLNLKRDANEQLGKK